LVVVVVAVDPYIYKITNNFLTCKIYFIL